VIRPILAFSVANRYAVILVTLIATAFGAWSLARLPIDAVPDVTNNQVQVNAIAPALTPVEIEKQVTVLVERALAGTPGLESLRSFSRNGFAQLTAVFSDKVDVYFARQQVNERLGEVRNTLPPGVEVRLGPISTGLGEIYWWAVEYQAAGDGAPVRDGLPGWQSDGSYLTPEGERLRSDFERTVYLRTVQDWIIRPQMKSVPGVAGADAIGGFVKEYQVKPDPMKLVGYGLGFADLTRAIGANNVTRGANYVERNGEGYVVRAGGLIENVDQIRDVVVATRAGIPILVRDVAEVGIGRELRTGSASENGREVVLGTALMLIGENSRTVSAAADAKIKEINKLLPPGIQARTLLSRTDLVDATIRTVSRNLAEGALLVVAVLFLALGNIRAAIITALVIPVAMMLTATGMLAGRISANLMSLGALDFGLIVDGAVIIAENSLRHLAERQHALGRTLSLDERLETVRVSAEEMIKPSVYGQAIIILVYVPLLTFTGMEGKTFAPMALTVLIALVAAFVLSLTFVPAMVATFITGRVGEGDNLLIRGLKAAYRPVLGGAVRTPLAFIGGAVVVLGLAGALATRLGQEFTPTLDEKNIVMEARRIPSTAISQSQAMQLGVEDAMSKFPEVAFVYSRCGTPDIAADPMPPNACDTYLILRPQAEWPDPSEAKESLIARMDAEAKLIPGTLLGFSQPIQMRFNELIAGVRDDLAVKVFGEEFGPMVDGARKIAGILRSLEGAADVKVEEAVGLPFLDQGRPARDRPARLEHGGRAGRHRHGGRRQGRRAGVRGRPSLRHRGPVGRRRPGRRRGVEEPAGAATALAGRAHADGHRGPGRSRAGRRYERAAAAARLVRLGRGAEPGEPRERPPPRRGHRERARARHRLAGGRGAGAHRRRGAAAARLRGEVGRAVREPDGRSPALGGGRAGLLRADLPPAPRGARVRARRADRVQRRADGPDRRRCGPVAARHALLGLGRGRVHRALGRRGPERLGAAEPHPRARGGGDGDSGCRPRGRPDPAAAGGYDGLGRRPGLRADGFGDGHRCGGAAAAGDRRHRRLGQRDRPDAAGPSGALRPVRQGQGVPPVRSTRPCRGVGRPTNTLAGRPRERSDRGVRIAAGQGSGQIGTSCVESAAVAVLQTGQAFLRACPAQPRARIGITEVATDRVRRRARGGTT